MLSSVPVPVAHSAAQGIRVTAPPLGGPVRFRRCAHVAAPEMRARVGQVGTVTAVLRRNGGWAVEVRFTAGLLGIETDVFTLEPDELEMG